MSRPTHAAQQQAITDALAALPSVRWRWLFTPDPRWLNTVNTTALRTVNAIRMYVGVTVLFALIEGTVVWKALYRCNALRDVPLGESETMAKVLLACENSLATGNLLEFAHTLFNSYGLILTAMAGIAVVELIGKRKTDTEHNVEVEKAKKAPIINQVTSERPAMPPVQQTVNVGADNGEGDEPQSKRPEDVV